jgi:2-methylcitrate dehydratase PrpD
MVLHGHAGYAAFTDAVLHDPAMVALRQRVHITEDPQLTAMAPRLKPAQVTVTLTSGRQCTRTCDSPRGDFQRPYEESDIRAKFRELAVLVLPSEGVRAVESALDHCDTWAQVRQLADTCRRYGSVNA